MTLVYGVGGGLGHLTRCRHFVETHGIGPCTLVSAMDLARLSRQSSAASPDAGTGAGSAGSATLRGDMDFPAISGGHRGRRIPRDLWRDRVGLNAWLRARSEELRPETVIVDAFPGGLMGELIPWPFGSVRALHLCRLMDWSAYRDRVPGPWPRYDAIHAFEALTAEHRAALDACSECIVEEAFRPLPALDEEVEAARGLRQSRHGDAPTWLIIHSGPLAEVAKLVLAAREEREEASSSARLLVITPRPTPQLAVDAIRFYPARAFFPHVERVYSGAGFNCLAERGLFAGPWRAMAFPRQFDLQFERLARCANDTALRKKA